MNTFLKELLGIHDPTETQKRADLAVEEYHRRCEDFDRAVCRCRNEDGIAIPSDERERSLINVNAKKVRDEVTATHRVNGKDFQEALKMWHH